MDYKETLLKNYASTIMDYYIHTNGIEYDFDFSKIEPDEILEMAHNLSSINQDFGLCIDEDQYNEIGNGIFCLIKYNNFYNNFDKIEILKTIKNKIIAYYSKPVKEYLEEMYIERVREIRDDLGLNKSVDSQTGEISWK